MNQIAYGIHPIKIKLKKHPETITVLHVQHDRHDKRLKELVHMAKSAQVKVMQSDSDALERLANTSKHQGVVAECLPSQEYSEYDIENLVSYAEKPLLLILDNIQDPHNLGACLRTADAAGVTAVITTKDKAVGLTPVVRKVASGAAETVPFIQVTNLARTLRQLKDMGVWLYGLAGEAEKTLYDVKFNGGVALVLGAEGSGLRRLTREECDELLGIPMQGTVDSLNVSVATAVTLFEVVRQRLLGST